MKRLIAAIIVSLLAFTGLTACGDSQLPAAHTVSRVTVPVKTPHRGHHTRECETHKSMTDFTQLDAEAQKLIDAAVAQQRSTDDVTISNLRAQLAACQASNGGGSTTPPSQSSVTATATAGDAHATLSWTVNNGPIAGLTGWHVARDGVDTNGAGAWGADLGASSTSFDFLSLVNGNTYNLTVAPIVNGSIGTAATVQATPTGASTGGGSTTPPPSTGNNPGWAQTDDTGFSYSGTWSTSTGEHYSSQVGATATISFTAGDDNSAVFSLYGVRGGGNGIVSVKVDDGAAVNVSEDGAAGNLVDMWDSPALAKGDHTVIVTVVQADGSIQGATLTNGTFKAPAANTGGGNTGGGGTTTPPPTTDPGTGSGGGTTTPPASGSNTLVNGHLIGGPASASNASGYLPPTADAFPGYTQVLSEDFNTAFGEGRQNGINVLGSGWFSYEGQENGNYGPPKHAQMYWDTDQISAAGGVVTMRNTNAGGNSQALTPIFRDSANAGKSPKAQGILFGKTAIRMKARGAAGYKIAFLMWPSDPNGWDQGEIDFPEGDTVSPNPASQPYTMTSNSHDVTGTNGSRAANGLYTDAKDVPGLGSKGVIDDGKYHTFVLHWDSDKIVFEMDGVVMSTITNKSYIPQVPMRWVLQCEPTDGGENNAANYIDIDWVAAYKKS